MTILLYLVPIALGLGFLGLAAFLWALRSGQFDDLDGAAERILFDDDEAEVNRPRKRHGLPGDTAGPSDARTSPTRPSSE